MNDNDKVLIVQRLSKMLGLPEKLEHRNKDEFILLSLEAIADRIECLEAL